MNIEENYIIGINDDRLKHSLQVGRKVQYLAEKLMGWDVLRCRQMFIMGFLHDIGYEYSLKQHNHENIGGELLRTVGYIHWREVFYHGKLTHDYESDELFILNYADLTTDSVGNDISIEKRLQDIADRYGIESEQFENASILADFVLKKLSEINWHSTT